MLRFEDRELEIRLAELQAEVQIFSTACFAFMSGVLALTATYFQLQYAISPTVTRILFGVSIILLNAILIAATFYSLRRAAQAKNQMKELRKRFAF